MRGEEDQEELKKKNQKKKPWVNFKGTKICFLEPDNSGLENKWNQDDKQANRHAEGEAGRMVVSQNLTLVISWVESATSEVEVVRTH